MSAASNGTSDIASRSTLPSEYLMEAETLDRMSGPINNMSATASQSTLPSENDMRARAISTSSAENDEAASVVLSPRSSALGEQSGFPFLKLPPELRNIIYRSVLHTPRRIFIYTSGTSRRGKEPYIVEAVTRKLEKPLPSGQLLRVNKQVYQEGLPVILGINNFAVGYFKSIEVFLGGLKPLGRSSIRNLHVCWGGDTRKHTDKTMTRSLSLLCECSNLQYLRVFLPRFKTVKAVQNLILANSNDIMKPLHELKKLTLAYGCLPKVVHSSEIQQLQSMYQQLVGPNGEFHVELLSDVWFGGYWQAE